MHKLYKLFLPSSTELIVYPIASIFTFIFLRITDVFEVIAGEGNGEELSSLFSTTIQDFLDDISAIDLSAQASLLIFWLIVGVIIYVVVVFTHSIWIETKNDVTVEEHFLHPRNYSFEGFWQTEVMRSLFRLSIFVMIAILIFVTFGMLLPLWLSLFDLWLDNLTTPLYWLLFPASIIGASVNLHLFVVLSRLFMLRTRVFQSS